MSPMLCRDRPSRSSAALSTLSGVPASAVTVIALAVDRDDAASSRRGSAAACSGAAIAVKLWPVPGHLHGGPGRVGRGGTASTTALTSAGSSTCWGTASSRPDQLRQRVPSKGVVMAARGHQGRGVRSGLGRRARRGPPPTSATRYAAEAPPWSTTSPARAAPGATPATSPVCMIAMPSVSRPERHALLGQGHGGDQGRARCDSPPTSSTHGHQRQGVDEGQRHHRERHRGRPQRSRSAGGRGAR